MNKILLSTVVTACVAGMPPAWGADASKIEELQKQIEALQKEVEALKQDRAAEAPGDVGDLSGLEQAAQSVTKGLSIGFYGEAKYRFPEQGDNTFDPHRFVLTPTYQINDWLIFNSELELEHGAVDESSNGGRDKFDGELELEQFYVDVLINDHFNVRSLGIDLMPVGRVNLYHEPTTFYSTERPELYREIIPTTWFEPSMGIFGKVVDDLDYRLMVSTGLEDAIPTPGSAATSTRPAGFAEPGVTGGSGMRNARPRLRRASEENLAVTGRLEYSGVPGLTASGSFYTTDVEGFSGDSRLTLLDVEGIYRVPRTGLEFRGEFAYWLIDSPENLVANNNSIATDDVGDSMYGWSIEAAYHFWPEAWRKGKGSEMDFVPFVRYTDIVTQNGLGPGGVDVDNGLGNRDFITFGAAYFLNRNFVFKGDYRHNLQGSSASAGSGASQDYFQLGAGVFF